VTRASDVPKRLVEPPGWLTEGFDTGDLVAARKLLDELEARP